MEFSFCSNILLIQYIEQVYKKLQKLSHFLAIWLISLNKPWNLIGRHVLVKAAKYEMQKPSTSCATLFRCKFWSMFPVFHHAWSTCRATKTFVAGWGIEARWLVDLQICFVTSCKFDEKRATKPRSTFRNKFL